MKLYTLNERTKIEEDLQVLKATLVEKKSKSKW